MKQELFGGQLLSFASEEPLFTKSIVFDSGAVSELSKQNQWSSVSNRLLDLGFCVYVPAPSYLEVGLGRKEDQHKSESSFITSLYGKQESSPFLESYLLASEQIQPGIRLLVPGKHEWFAARHMLIELMRKGKLNSLKSPKDKLDALIWACAVNTMGTIVTKDSDYQKFVENQSSGHRPMLINPKELLVELDLQ